MLLSLRPTHIGIKKRSIMIPAIPTTIPKSIIPSNTIIIDIPRPSTKEETTAYTTLPRIFPSTLIGAAPDIFLYTIIVAKIAIKPTAVQPTPILNIPHSGRRHMHIPSANTNPATVPNTNVIKRVSVPEEWVIEIFERLAASRISAYPMLDMGGDGSFTELEIGGYCGKSLYRWWGDAPESWELLEEIAQEIYDKFYINKK